MHTYRLNDHVLGIDIAPGFDETCVICLTETALSAVMRGALKVRIERAPGDRPLQNLRISVGSIGGNLKVRFGGNSDGATVLLGTETRGEFSLLLWRGSEITIGERTTSNGVRVFANLAKVSIGKDCMFSDGVLIQASDEHGLVDIASGEIYNNRLRIVNIYDHVWLGRDSTVMPDVSIGDGAVIGAGAVVTQNIAPFCVAVGIPARTVKTGVTWSRDPARLDEASREFMRRADSHLL